MYLKSLVMKGFKSFADRSVLTLEPGMTVVVGPNGSGKSNIADAVLWVLGEQSAKTLRAGGMEDVIFSGSSSRKAVGLAEVDLVLDNTDGTLPLDFGEVVVTRRMYRSGESEYLINGAPSRLMDVQEILGDCGLGRDTHSIISQGSLANVLRAKPEDRRVLIEEAAGILKHKKRKERASRKLANMETELVRVRDIAAEIDRQLAPLERQAGRAAKHDEISSRLREAKLELAVDDLRALQTEWQGREKDASEADAAAELVRFRLADKQRELEKCQRLLEEKGLFVGDLAEQRSRCQSALERLDAGMLLLEEKGRNMVERLSELRQSIHRSESRLSELDALADTLEAERRDARAARDELERQIADGEALAAQLEAARDEADSRVASLAADVRAVERESDECALGCAKATEELSTADTQDGLLAQRIEQIDDELAQTRGTLAARRGRIDELDDELSKLERDGKLAKSDIDKRVRLEDDARARLDAAREELSGIDAELKGLKDVDRAVDEASPMLAWGMEHASELEGLVGPVSEAIDAPADLERLVGRLLGSDMFGLVVEDAASAASVAGRLLDAAGDTGEMSLVTLRGAADVDDAEAPTDGEHLIDLLSYDERYARAVEALLADVWVTDDIDSAVAAASEWAARGGRPLRFATRDGAVAWSCGKLTVGTCTTDAEGLLGRKRRINALADSRPAAEEALADAEEALAEATRRLQLAQADDFDISQSIAQLTGERASLREEVARLETSITTAAAERAQIAERRTALADETSAAREELAALEERKKELSERADALADELAAARGALDSASERVAEKARGASSIKVELATVGERDVHLSSRIDEIAAERSQLESALAVSRETESGMEVLRLRVEPLYAVFSELRDGLAGKASVLQDRARLEQAGSSDLKDTIAEARSAVAKAQGELDEANAKLADLRVEKSKLEVRVEQAVHVITDDMGTVLDVALERELSADRAEVEEEVASLERKLKRLGAVNPVAADEYRTLRERRDHIGVELDDLEGAAKSLERIVAAVDRKMKNCFLETFEEVAANFSEIFSQLFPGGQGHLELTDPSHPAETGVEVHAQPVGKTVKKQTLLSGGEQSLVVLALLFSVYRVRKTPFYILDEVEAALDDTNLRRLLAYLDGIRDETQFIVISHQRRTMEMADLLFGVSMRGDGVSKLVSQKLDQAIRTAQ